MEAVNRINELARRVTVRRQLFSLQDNLALALFAGGLLAALAVVFLKWRALQASVWGVALAAFAAAIIIFLIRWRMTRAGESETSFLIDNSLDLEDRFTTARSLIARGETDNAVRLALIEDAANRIAETRPEAIAPYRVKKFYALSLVALLAFGASLMIPDKTLPGSIEIAEAREDIQAAGEQLEKNSTEIEKFTPPQSVTANLAKEQAELGRSLRRSTETRAEVLKKLSALEERIRQRADELKSTGAEEVVAAAEKTMRPALATAKERTTQPPVSEKAASNRATEMSTSAKANKADEKSTSAKNAEAKAASADLKENQAEKGTAKNAEQPKANQVAANQEKESSTAKPNPDGQKPESNQTAESKPRESGQPQTANPNDPSNSKGDGQKPDANSAQQPGKIAAGNPQQPQQGEPQNKGKQAGEEGAGQEEEKAGETKEGEQGANPLTDLAAQQTAKAMPALSETLMQKAGELRAGQMKPEEIARLAQSAGQLAASLAKSEAGQQALAQMAQQLAKQINPEQLERFAQELMKNEQLKKELEAAAKLLSENQEVKKMVAGLQRMGEEIARDWERRNGQRSDRQGEQSENSRDSRNNIGNQEGQTKGSGQGTQTTRAEGNRNLQGQGQEKKVGGKLQPKPGGEYVYSGSKPGVGAVRVPYSSAYPQYRREAERTVERSQVPTHLRSMVRNYFDAINPDAKKSN